MVGVQKRKIRDIISSGRRESRVSWAWLSSHLRGTRCRSKDASFFLVSLIRASSATSRLQAHLDWSRHVAHGRVQVDSAEHRLPGQGGISFVDRWYKVDGWLVNGENIVYLRYLMRLSR